MEQILNERSREKRERLQLDRMARLEEEVRVLGLRPRARSKQNKMVPVLAFTACELET